MNIRDLHYLIAVAELKHFGKAAERCHVSQPTLSGQIKKLEEELGVTLFERTNRKVMLTETGAQIVAAARQALAGAEAMRRIAAHAQDPLAGPFRLGAFPTLAPYLFPTLAPRIHAIMPKLRLILIEDKTDQLIGQLLAGTLDAALLALPLAEETLESQQLFDDTFYLAVAESHPLARRSSLSMKELEQEPLLLLEEGHCLRDQALEVCRLHRLNEAQDVRATSLETLRQMVRIGTGITLMPHIAMRKDETGIRYLPLKDAPNRSIGLVWRKSSARRAAIDSIVRLFQL